jgi:hypothetical protein
MTVRHLYPHIAIITLDSCRWDTFAAADMQSTLRGSEPVRCFAQATFTYAAHMALFQGILPHAYADTPFYNRYNRQLFRLARRPCDNPPWLSIDASNLDLISGLSALGYRTVGLAAMEWFRHPDLARHFENFTHTGIHAMRQAEIASHQVRSATEPLFLLVNMGETHHPYQFSRTHAIPPAPFSRARMGPLPSLSDSKWEQQVECCTFLDSAVSAIIDELLATARPTLVVVCGDHGECFGEDGQWGHGFYHPKVMEVPMVIHFLNGLSSTGFPVHDAGGRE